MEKIGSIAVTQLHVASHVDFHQGVYTAMVTAQFQNATLKALFIQYIKELNTLKEVVRRQHASVWTADVAEADRLRDSTMRQMFMMIDAATRSTVADEKDAALKVQTLVGPYRKDPQDQMTDQSEQIKGMLRAITTTEALPWVTKIGIVQLCSRLETQNDNFMELYQKRAAERETQPGGGIETVAQRRVVDAIYRSHVDTVNSIAVAAAAGIDTGVAPETLATYIQTVNGLIAQYKLVIANQGKGHEVGIDAAIKRTAQQIASLRDALAATEARHADLIAQKAAGVGSVVEELIADAADQLAADDEALYGTDV